MKYRVDQRLSKSVTDLFVSLWIDTNPQDLKYKNLYSPESSKMFWTLNLSKSFEVQVGN